MKFVSFLLPLVTLVHTASIRPEIAPKAGFSRACRGAKSISVMTKDAEIVTEAVVVEVSPPRDNVYAVTLQVKKVFKGDAEEGSVGPLLQLLFIKPKTFKNQPEVRSLPESRKYLEACIYEMDLKKGKKYNLFLARQPGTMSSEKGKMARYVMTSPPILSSRKSRRKIISATCTKCGNKPRVKSLEMNLMKNGKKLKLVCKTKNKNKDTQILWRKDGAPIKTDQRIKIRQRRDKSVLTVSQAEKSDSGTYSCIVKGRRGQDSKKSNVTIKQKLKPTTTTTTTTKTTTTSTTTTEFSSSTPPLPRTAAYSNIPGGDSPCPISGYCLNDGKCNFIPWLGEMSCSCAPGFQGARCDRKTTSALYSSSLSLSNTLCLFGIVNPYHSC